MVDTVELAEQTEAVTDAISGWLGDGDKVMGVQGGAKAAFPLGSTPAMREFDTDDSDLEAADYGRVLLLIDDATQNVNVQLEDTIAYGAGFECLLIALTNDATLTFQTGASVNGQTTNLVWSIEAVATSQQGAYLKKRTASDEWLLLGATPVEE